MSAPSPRSDYGLRYHKRMLYIFGSLSVLGNVAYGLVSGTGTLPALATAAVASVFPLTLMAASDDLVVLARHCTGAVRASMMAMAAATAVLMFIVSFDALSGLFVMAGKGDLVAKCGAVAIDLMVVQASISALWASNKVREAEVVTEAAAVVGEPVDGDRQADDEAVHEPLAAVVHEPVHKPSTVVDDARAQLAMPVDAAVDETADTVDDQTVDEVPATVDNRVVDEFSQVGAVDEPSLTVDGADDGAVHSVDDDRAQSLSTAGDQLVDNVAAEPVHSPVHSVVDGAQPLSTAGDEPLHSAVDDASAPVDGDEALARAVVDAIRTKAAVDDVVAALRLRREGQSMAAIAAELGVGSHSTVSRWIKAAETLEAQPVG